ncbi:hypothetical protein MSAN_01666400 [Mycena sanguinolenta]|uniref:Uncharacterized protein n=1 Tax=Mycena sanguinolenta TaxID=230812 RepID=A0A8H7CWY5_9AGAR|nr:hypothetical protein MSAN_01666400 [Mycena sanguinolenta]
MNRSHNRPSDRNTDDCGSSPPNQYQPPPNAQYGDPNAQFPGYRYSAPSARFPERQSAPNFGRSNTQPIMAYNPQNRQYLVDTPARDVDAEYLRRQANQRPIVPPMQSTYPAPPLRQANRMPVAPPLQPTQHNPQNRQHTVANAPVFDADAALAEYLQRQANQRPSAPPLRSTYSAPDRRGPAPQRPASMAISVSSQSNSRGIGHSRDDFSSSPEDVAPSSWSLRRSSMSEYPPALQNWSQTPRNRNQFVPPPSSSYQARPQTHERRREARDDRGSGSGSDSEDSDPPFSSSTRRPQPRRTSSQGLPPRSDSSSGAA